MAALLAVGAALLVGCGSGAPAPAAPAPGVGGPAVAPAPVPGRTLTVLASTNVWGDVVSAIAGPGVQVRSVITDPAADPHAYEATPADAAALAAADLVVINGGGYDEWAEQIAAQDPAVAAKVVQAFALRPDQGQDNEHVWFDPTTVNNVVAQVTDRLTALEPAQADPLRQRAAGFTAQVDRIGAELAVIGRARPDTRVAATEPIAFYLLAGAGVADVTPPAFVEAIEEETDPPVAAVATTRDLLAARQVAALVFNPQTETPITTQIRGQATAAGLPVVEVTETLPANTSYLTWLEANRVALARAVGAPA